MKYGTIDLGQIEALINYVGGEDNVGKILSGKVKLTLSEVEPEKHLAFRRNFTLPARATLFDPREFFKNRPGLYVWDDFRERIVSVAKPTDTLPETVLASFDLSLDSNDAEIRAGLPEGHVFQDASEFLLHLVGMIELQKDGGEGELLNNGYANIFYVLGAKGEVFAVRVRWLSDDRGWRVNALRLVEFRWLAGHRAFSARPFGGQATAVA